MDLDLSSEGVLSVELAKLITDIEVSSRSTYTEYIDKLSSSNKLAGISLLLQVSNRNTTKSKIHEKFCKYELVIYLLNQGKSINSVLVDDDEDKRVIDQIFKCHNKTVKITTRKPRIFLVYVAANFLRVLYHLFISIWLSILLKNKNSSKPVGKIIFIDTFMSVSSIRGKKYFDERYYRGMEDYISDETKNSIWYAPVLFNFKTLSDFFALYRFASISSSNLLQQYQYLNINDYVKAFFLSFKLCFSITDYPEWNNYDISGLINKEVNEEIFSVQLFQAILRFFFIKRLSEQHVDLEVVINWNENQVIDRALCLGVRKFYPEVKIKGYQGLVPPRYYASLEPTCFEIESNTIPDAIYVIGDAFSEFKKSNCSSTMVKKAPAYRFLHIYNIEHKNISNSKVVFVALPFYINECTRILRLCLEASRVLGDDYVFEIKLHPSHDEKKFNESIPNDLSYKYSFTNLEISQLLSMSSMLLSSASSTCLEAAVLGLPVAIMGNISGPTQNPLVGLIDPDRWNVVYTVDDFIELIIHSKVENHLDLTKFFSKPSVQNTKEFLSSNL